MKSTTLDLSRGSSKDEVVKKANSTIHRVMEDTDLMFTQPNNDNSNLEDSKKRKFEFDADVDDYDAEQKEENLRRKAFSVLYPSKTKKSPPLKFSASDDEGEEKKNINMWSDDEEEERNEAEAEEKPKKKNKKAKTASMWSDDEGEAEGEAGADSDVSSSSESSKEEEKKRQVTEMQAFINSTANSAIANRRMDSVKRLGFTTIKQFYEAIIPVMLSFSVWDVTLAHIINFTPKFSERIKDRELDMLGVLGGGSKEIRNARPTSLSHIIMEYIGTLHDTVTELINNYSHDLVELARQEQTDENDQLMVEFMEKRINKFVIMIFQTVNMLGNLSNTVSGMVGSIPADFRDHILEVCKSEQDWRNLKDYMIGLGSKRDGTPKYKPNLKDWSKMPKSVWDWRPTSEKNKK